MKEPCGDYELFRLEKNEENILHVSFYREIGEEKMGNKNVA